MKPKSTVRTRTTSRFRKKTKEAIASSLESVVPAVLTLLGTGTSSGVPLIGCRCGVCRSENPKNKRLRVSAWVRIGSGRSGILRSLVIDTSTDFRQQALRARIPRVDAVLYTHPHADHIGGIDDLRAYNFVQNQVIPVYGHAWTQSDLMTRFEYVFTHRPSEGGGLPQLSFNLISEFSKPIWIADTRIVPILLPHGKDTVLGYRLGDLAYITDVHELTDEAIGVLQGLETLVLDCVRIQPHRTHLNLDRAIHYAERVGARRTVLTHLGHEFDHERTEKSLPRGIRLGFDGQKILFRATIRSGVAVVP